MRVYVWWEWGWGRDEVHIPENQGELCFTKTLHKKAYISKIKKKKMEEADFPTGSHVENLLQIFLIYENPSRQYGFIFFSGFSPSMTPHVYFVYAICLPSLVFFVSF